MSDGHKHNSKLLINVVLYRSTGCVNNQLFANQFAISHKVMSVLFTACFPCKVPKKSVIAGLRKQELIQKSKQCRLSTSRSYIDIPITVIYPRVILCYEIVNSVCSSKMVSGWPGTVLLIPNIHRNGSQINWFCVCSRMCISIVCFSQIAFSPKESKKAIVQFAFLSH